MIQIEAIHIEEFRGIRELDLTLASKSFVIFGPNGSGKSGVVDAIDFALSGNIARLSGPGTSGLSVLKHGPHVHQRDNAAAAKVALTVRDTDSRQIAVLTRCVKTANIFTLDPDTPAMRAVVAQTQQHPELTLSRREIIKYVVTEPGKRAQEVQALLKLDRIDETRRLFRTAQSKSSTEASRAESEVKAAEDSMRRHLDLTTLLTSEVTAAINKRRQLLGLPPLESVTTDTDLSADAEGGAHESAFNKTSALADVNALTQNLGDTPALMTRVEPLVAALDELIADPTIMASLQHRNLVESGIALISDSACPLCDTAWPDVDALRIHLSEKLARSSEAAALQRRIQTEAGAVTQGFRALRDLIRAAIPHAVAFGGNGLSHRLQAWADDLVALETNLGTIDGALDQQERLATDPLRAPNDLQSDLDALTAAIDTQPDQGAAVSARSFLTVAQERWARVRLARADHEKLAATRDTAVAVYDTYCAVADSALSTLYKAVEDEFSAYYRRINSDDESSFTAGLEPSAGKLDLEVDFYGLGMFPPAAYHSEGHQDGMGVCLYLALVKQLLRDKFRFAVLDDVVMSVDQDHRREFCILLKDVFPDVQFVITTHDEVWARQMQSAGLVGRTANARFHGWSVDGGPVYEQGGDIWKRIDADVNAEDIPGGAHKLRRYLEASMTDLAHSLGAKVVFRADGNYDLSALLSAVIGRHNELLKKAAASANAWSNATAKQRVDELKADRAKVVPAQEAENWAINKLVHNNDWARMGKADFAPVVTASRNFLELFSCNNPDCSGRIYVVGQPGKEESLNCACGDYHLNLRGK